MNSSKDVQEVNVYNAYLMILWSNSSNWRNAKIPPALDKFLNTSVIVLFLNWMGGIFGPWKETKRIVKQGYKRVLVTAMSQLIINLLWL